MAQTSGQGPSWKNRPKADAPLQAGKRTWQFGTKRNAQGTPENSQRGSLLLKRVLGALALLVVIGLMTWGILQLIPTKPLTVVLFSYSDPAALNLPLNIYNVEFAKELQGWCEAEKNKRNFVELENEWRTGENNGDYWMKWLIKKGRDCKSDTVVFFLGMPGHSDPDRGPFVWVVPPNAKAPQQEHKLFLRDFLGSLKELRGKKKIIICDCSQVASSWLHGMVQNDFAQGLKTIEKDIKDVTDCAVICACSPGQRSWVSPERGLSIFAHYFMEALQGGARQKSAHPRITLKDVCEHLQDSVNKWSLANRGFAQQILVLPNSNPGFLDTFELTNSSSQQATSPKVENRELDGLKKQWQEYYQISGQVPSPEETAPHTWRQYTDLLLRLEQIVWAGRDKDAATVEQRISTLANELRQIRSPLPTDDLLIQDLHSASVQSLMAKDQKLAQAAKLLGALWRGDEDAGKSWDKFVLDMQNQPNLQSQVAILGWRWVIDQFQRENNVLVAEKLLNQLETSLRQATRPADVHLLRMIARDNREGPWLKVLEQKDLLSQTLKLCRKAELTAWKGTDEAEAKTVARIVQIYPRIKEQIEKADQLRRQGEDLLFDAHKDSWDQAKASISEAGRLYSQTQDQARIILDELQLRDQAFARLPYYSRWVADYRSDPESNTKLRELTDLVERGWIQAHDLAARLQQTEKVAATAQLTEGLKKNLQEIEKKMREQIEAYRGSSAAQPSTWQALEALIQTPFFAEPLDASTMEDRTQEAVNRRAEILRKLKDTSFQLAKKWEQTENLQGASPSYYSPDRAARHLRLGLDCLGKDVIDEMKKAQLLSNSALVNFGTTPNQSPEEVARWADQMGRAYSALGELLTSQQHPEAAEAQEALGNNGTIKKLASAERWFAKTSGWVRQLPTGIMEPFHLSAGISFLQVNSSFQAHRFLLWQAERALADGWADVSVGAEDYALITAKNQLKMAKELLRSLTKEDNPSSDKKGWYAAVDDLRLTLAKPSMTLEGLSSPGQIYVTDEEFIKVRYNVSQNTIRGIPIIRIWSDTKSATASKMLSLRNEAADSHYFSQPATVSSGKIDWKNPNQNATKPQLEEAAAELRSMLLYRGHYYQDQLTKVNFITTPILRWTRTPHAPDKKPGLVVFASDDIAGGHIHILFDVTSSMTEKIRGGEEKKINIAKNALEAILSKIPKGVRLSLSFFCAFADKGNPEVEDKNRKYGENPRSCTKLVFGPEAWDPNHLNRVISMVPGGAELESLNGNKTPILDALSDTLKPGSVNDQLRIDSNTHLTLLMITDGVENVKSEDTHCGEGIIKLLLNSKNTPCDFHMMLFSLSEEDFKDPYCQKKVKELDLLNQDETKNRFYEAERSPPHLWKDINSKDMLLKSLNDALRPKLAIYRDNRLVDSNLTIKSDQDTNWNTYTFREPGSYTLMTSSSRQTLRIEPEDHFALRLKRGYPKEMLMIPSIADIHPGIDSSFYKKQNDIQLTLLRQKTESPAGGVNFLETGVALEKPILEPGGELHQARPALAWFSLKPIGNHQGQIPLEVSNISGELAPLWQLHALNWPARDPGTNKVTNPAPYRLVAYWIKDLHAPKKSHDLPSFKNINEGYQLPSSVLGMTYKEIGIRKNVKGRDWLYVSCQHPHDQPFVLQLRSSDHFSGPTEKSIAEEHRFYPEADSVSAWFDISSLLEGNRKFTLDVYQLESILKNSEDTIRIDYESNDPVSERNFLENRRWPDNKGTPR